MPAIGAPIAAPYLAYEMDASGRITHTVPIGRYLLIGGLIPAVASCYWLGGLVFEKHLINADVAGASPPSFRMTSEQRQLFETEPEPWEADDQSQQLVAVGGSLGRAVA